MHGVMILRSLNCKYMLSDTITDMFMDFERKLKSLA